MSDEPTERDVEALAEVLAGHEWSPGYMHPEETCTCGWVSEKYGSSPCEAESVEAVSDDHRNHVAAQLAERIAEARREGAAEVADRVEMTLRQSEGSGTYVLRGPIRDALAATLRGDTP